MAKRRKRKNSILSGLIIVLCILIILPVISLVFKFNKTSSPSVEEKPSEQSSLYYEVSFVVDDCCVPISSMFVKVGEAPVLPTCEIICEHQFCDLERWEFNSGHSFICWTYNGQFITQENCPAFNRSVVLVANIEDQGFPVADYNPEWDRWIDYEN